jgi:hypothetical protein
MQITACACVEVGSGATVSPSDKRRGEVAKPFAMSSMQHIVQRVRKELGLPSYFTLDACGHGGMTELEEAELTDGQGRALSAHKTQQSYAGYAKRTEKRMLSATRKRFAHKLSDHQAAENEAETSLQNEHLNRLQNEGAEHRRFRNDISWLATQCCAHPSPAEFPANREFYREISQLWGLGDDFGVGSPCATATFRAFPYSDKQGKQFKEQGIFRTYQGIEVDQLVIA